ncbi:MAG: DUF2809 domain-containing protein [Eubacteriales bacterium]
MKKRALFAIISLVLFIIEVIIALFVRDNFIRPYVGDILVVVLLYFIMRAIFPKPIKLLPVYLFLFATSIEILQYFDYVTLLGLGDSRFFRTLLGTTFSWEDILCYGVGSVICWGFQCKEQKKGGISCYS